MLPIDPVGIRTVSVFFVAFAAASLARAQERSSGPPMAANALVAPSGDSMTAFATKVETPSKPNDCTKLRRSICPASNLPSTFLISSRFEFMIPLCHWPLLNRRQNEKSPLRDTWPCVAAVRAHPIDNHRSRFDGPAARGNCLANPLVFLLFES